MEVPITARSGKKSTRFGDLIAAPCSESLQTEPLSIGPFQNLFGILVTFRHSLESPCPASQRTPPLITDFGRDQ